MSTLRRSRDGLPPAGSTAFGHQADTDGSSSPRFGRCCSSCPARASDRERTPRATRPVVGGHSATHGDRSGRRDHHLAAGSRRSVAVPLQVGEVISLLERDGWRWARSAGSRRHYVHPVKPGLVTVAGSPARPSRPGTRPASRGRPARRGARWSSSKAATSPGTRPVRSTYPVSIAAAATTVETLAHLREAMSEHSCCRRNRDYLSTRRVTPSTSLCSTLPPPDRGRAQAPARDVAETPGQYHHRPPYPAAEGW